MKSVLSLIAFTFFCIASASAQADPVKALSMHVDFFPNNEYAIYLDLDANNLITQVYYEINGNKDPYTLKQLQSPVTLFSAVGIDFVQMKIASNSGDRNATIELICTLNYLTHKKMSLFFDVTYNELTKQYEVRDNRNHQIITEADVSTHYVIGPVGVGSITTK